MQGWQGSAPNWLGVYPQVAMTCGHLPGGAAPGAPPPHLGQMQLNPYLLHAASPNHPHFDPLAAAVAMAVAQVLGGFQD